MLHMHSSDTSIHYYHVTSTIKRNELTVLIYHTPKIIRNKYTFLPCYTHSYETNIHSDITSEYYGVRMYSYGVKNTVIINKLTFLPR